jgi:hypothetical protein
MMTTLLCKRVSKGVWECGSVRAMEVGSVRDRDEGSVRA